MSSVELSPPKALPKVTETTIHGEILSDEFAWLRMENWQELMEDTSVLPQPIREYLEAEDQYTSHILSSTEALQDVLYKELRGRILEKDSSVPEADGPWLYYSRYNEGGQYPLFCRKPRLDAVQPEQILIDGEEESKGFEYFDICGGVVSPSHRLVAYGLDCSGAEIFSLYIKDIENNIIVAGPIADTTGDYVFIDEKYILYTVLDEQHRPRFVKRHEIGTDPESDVLIYEESDLGFFVGLDRTESKSYILLTSNDYETSEVRMISVVSPLDEPILVAERRKGVEYEVSHRNGYLILRSNYGEAEDYTLYTAEVEKIRAGQGFDCWSMLIPAQPGRLLLDYYVSERYLVCLELYEGLPNLKYAEWSSNSLGSWHNIEVREDVYTLSLVGSREFGSEEFRYVFSSMRVPSRVYDYNMSTHTQTLKKEQEVPSGHVVDDYCVKRLHFESHDGVKVPVSLLYHRDTVIDGTAPLWLHGYGAYGEIDLPGFRTSPLSLVDRGVVYAEAHVRGGMFKGYRWYKDGKLENKENTFKDYIACAEGLASSAYCAHDKIVCYGGSAGGMLIGVVVNRRPDLFYAAVADVPFVDVLNTMLDATLPLTPPEWLEWGNPIEDYEAFKRLQSYSPYENVSEQNYPHMLVMAGLTDPRVTYWEPAKWVARLRARKTGNETLLLKINMHAGHGGASGRFDFLKEMALVQAFVLSKLGLVS